METTEKEIKILREIDKLLPNVKLSPLRLGNQNSVQSIHYLISPHNADLKESDYFYNKELKFVHFTNLFAIQSIIAEKSIRLYNIYNLNDPREYSYAGNLLASNKKNKVASKKNLFLLSMCNQDVLIKGSTEIEFNLWRLYGNNGLGAAIILNFDSNPPINWKDYFLSVVHYGPSCRTKLKQLNTLVGNFEKGAPMISIDLGQIVCFHKSKLYSLEQEIRLLFDYRLGNLFGATHVLDGNNKLISPIIRSDIARSTQRNRTINYLELPIYSKDFNPISNDNLIPIPKIEKIILGYQYKKIKGISDRLNILADEKLGYRPKIERSRLTPFYHDR